MKQLNGYFGCPLCEDEGEIVSQSLRIYPCQNVIKMRTYESYQKNLSEAEKLQAAGRDPSSKYFRRQTKGVKSIRLNGLTEKYIYKVLSFFLYHLVQSTNSRISTNSSSRT